MQVPEQADESKDYGSDVCRDNGGGGL
jgi:hypothetical protein